MKCFCGLYVPFTRVVRYVLSLPNENENVGRVMIYIVAFYFNALATAMLLWKNKFSGGLQSRLVWKIRFLEVLKLGLCDCNSLLTQRRKGLNLENDMIVTGLSSQIQPIKPWWWWICKLVRLLWSTFASPLTRLFSGLFCTSGYVFCRWSKKSSNTILN